MASRLPAVLAAAGCVGASAAATAAPWEDATAATIGATAGWSNKVRLCDVDGDGDVDILLANGAGYDAPGGPEPNGVFLNQGTGAGGVPAFEDGTLAVFGAMPDAARVIVPADLTGDGTLDLFVGTTWGTRSRLFAAEGGGFSEVTDTALPDTPGWVGDAEAGDADGDGDLDLVLADWGGHPAGQAEGFVRLWRNDGTGRFVEATAEAMPDTVVGWSWELELVDVDNDWDLDVAVSCKACPGSKLYENDGTGLFIDVTEGRMPQLSNNYEFEPMDIDGDGYLDLVTINDHAPGTRNGIFLNDGAGGFVDATDTLWPAAENPAGDDNMVAFVDADSDGDPDFVVAGLFGQPDRLMVNMDGGFVMDAAAFSPATSPGTLGIAVSDLNGDGRWDVVMAEGEASFPDYVFLGVDLPPDTAPPVVAGTDLPSGVLDGAPFTVHARVHDHKSPLEAHDLSRVELEFGPQGRPGAVSTLPLAWYGEYLFRAEVDPSGWPAGPTVLRVCAEDRVGLRTCSEERVVTVGGGATTGGAGTAAGDESGGTTATSGASAAGSSDAAGTAGGTGGATADEDEGGTGCTCRLETPRFGPASGWPALLVFGLRRRVRSGRDQGLAGRKHRA